VAAVATRVQIDEQQHHDNVATCITCRALSCCPLRISCRERANASRMDAKEVEDAVGSGVSAAAGDDGATAVESGPRSHIAS
jgi:hypothetical protein